MKKLLLASIILFSATAVAQDSELPFSATPTGMLCGNAEEVQEFLSLQGFAIIGGGIGTPRWIPNTELSPEPWHSTLWGRVNGEATDFVVFSISPETTNACILETISDFK